MKKAKAEYVFFTMLFIALMGIFTFTSFVILYKLDMMIYYCHNQDVDVPIGRMNAISYHSWTKAIYDGDRILRNHIIECEGDKLVNLTPTGNFVYVKENWIDPRPVELQNRWCEK